MSTSPPMVFSVTSGKGGVGKTNISVNLATCLAASGKRVVLVDADLGLANVDVMLGLMPHKNLFHLFNEGAELSDVLFETPYGFSILPASSGVSDMLLLSTGQKLELLEAVDILEKSIDYLVVDTGAGINGNVLYFNLAVAERLLVLTTEPTSLTDAYALIKVLKVNHDVDRFKIVVNMTPDQKTGKEVFNRLYQTCDRFLDGVFLDFLGSIPRDPTVRKAVIAQRPFYIENPQTPASEAIRALTNTIMTWEAPESLDGNIKFFWKRLLFS